MNADIKCNVNDSVATSAATSPAESRRGEAPRAENNISQEEFLRREAARTKAAMLQSLEDLKTKLRVSADVRLWTKEHPLAAVAMAAAGGFVAATVLTPSRDESFREKMSRLAESVQPAASSTAGADVHAASRNPGLKAVVVSSLIDLARTAMENIIAASTEARAQQAATVEQTGPFDYAGDGSEWQS